MLADEAFDAVEFLAVKLGLTVCAGGVGQCVRLHCFVGREEFGVEVTFRGLTVFAFAFEVKRFLEDLKRGSIVFGTAGSIFLFLFRFKFGVARLIGGQFRFGHGLLCR